MFDDLLKLIPPVFKPILMAMIGVSGMDRLRTEFDLLGRLLANHRDQEFANRAREVLFDLGIDFTHYEDQNKTG